MRGTTVPAKPWCAKWRVGPESRRNRLIHSLLWFALAVALVATLYRRVHGASAVAGLAGLLFAVEDAHAWLANRNALVCLVCGAAVTGLLARLWTLLRRERLARVWFLGMALSVIPLCAAFPMDRLLVFSGIGAFGLMALLLRHAGVWPWEPGRPWGWRRVATNAGPLVRRNLFFGAVVAGSWRQDSCRTKTMCARRHVRSTPP